MKTQFFALAVLLASGRLTAAIEPGWLTLEIKLNKTEYIVAEPGHVDIALINLRRAPIDVAGNFTFGRDLQLKYRVRGADRWFVFLPSALPPDDSDATRFTLPINGWSRSADLIYDGNRVRAINNIEEKIQRKSGAFFDLPGVYEFQAEYRLDRDKLVSNLVQVTVHEPSRGADVEALRLWLDPEVLYYVQFPEGLHEDLASVRNRLQSLMEQFPESSYAEFARRALAHNGILTPTESEPKRVAQSEVAAKGSEIRPRVGLEMAQGTPTVRESATAAKGSATLGQYRLAWVAGGLITLALLMYLARRRA